MKINCEQFELLMNYYLNNELSTTIKSEFEKHMLECESCQKKFYTFKRIITELRDSYNKFSNYKKTHKKTYSQEQQSLNSNISAYIDNELDLKENIKIKKMIISKPDIRKKIEQMYQLKLLLKNSFLKTQPQKDYSKNLIKKIYSTERREMNKKVIFTIFSFLLLSIIWIIMLISAISI